MKRRRTIFDSKSERSGFRQLQSRWAEKLRLYPQLPLAKLIDLEPGDLDGGQTRYFYATNVDYTFCDLSDRPLFSIEYDGIGGGLSIGAECKQKRATVDPRRSQKMTLKLEAAAAAGYPLFVVSIDELQSLDADDEFTILDGIVGNLLQHLAWPGLARAMLAEEEGSLDEMASWERDELAQDIALQAEVLAEAENDLLASRATELQFQASQLGAGTHRLDWMFDPELPDLNPVWPPDAEQVLARAEAMGKADRLGCRVVVDLPGMSVPRIIRTAWMRNIEAPGVSAMSVVKNMAEYFAFKQAVRLLQRSNQAE